MITLIAVLFITIKIIATLLVLAMLCSEANDFRVERHIFRSPGSLETNNAMFAVGCFLHAFIVAAIWLPL